MTRLTDEIKSFLADFLGDSAFALVFHDGLHFPFSENRVLSLEHIDDTILADIECFPVVVHLAGNIPARCVGTFSGWTILCPLTFHDFPAGPVAFWYHSQSPLLKVITK
jgi:hypothetical protein